MRRSTYILILIQFAAMACLLAAAAHAVANPPRWVQPSRVYVPPPPAFYYNPPVVPAYRYDQLVPLRLGRGIQLPLVMEATTSVSVRRTGETLSVCGTPPASRSINAFGLRPNDREGSKTDRRK